MKLNFFRYPLVSRLVGSFLIIWETENLSDGRCPQNSTFAGTQYFAKRSTKTLIRFVSTKPQPQHHRTPSYSNLSACLLLAIPPLRQLPAVGFSRSNWNHQRGPGTIYTFWTFLLQYFGSEDPDKTTFLFEVRLFVDDQLISRLPRNQTCHKFLSQTAVVTEMQLAICLKIGTQTSLKHSFLVGGNFMETNSVQCNFFCI